MLSHEPRDKVIKLRFCACWMSAIRGVSSAVCAPSTICFNQHLKPLQNLPGMVSYMALLDNYSKDSSPSEWKLWNLLVWNAKNRIEPYFLYRFRSNYGLGHYTADCQINNRLKEKTISRHIKIDSAKIHIKFGSAQTRIKFEAAQIYITLEELEFMSSLKRSDAH